MPSLAEARANVAADTAPDTESVDGAPKIEAPTAAKPVRAKAEPKVATECACQTPECTSTSKGKFAPGHDAKLVKHLTAQAVYHGMSQADAETALKERSGNSVLLLNKLKSSIERETGVRDRKVRREAAKAEATETKAAVSADTVAAEVVES